MTKPKSPNTEIITVDPSNPDHLALFEQTFVNKGNLYERQFPDAGEREDPKETLEYMKDGSGVVSIMVRNDPQSGAREPVGFCYSNTFDVTNPETGKESTGALVAYISKDNLAEQKYGESFNAQDILEQNLTDVHAQADKPIEGVYWEANRPDRYAKDGAGGLRHDSMDPQQRLDIVERYGFSHSGLNYEAPPLEAGERPDPDMHLLRAGVTLDQDGRASIVREGLDSREAIGHTQGFLQAYYEDMEAEKDPALQKQLGALEARKDGVPQGKGMEQAEQRQAQQTQPGGNGIPKDVGELARSAVAANLAALREGGGTHAAAQQQEASRGQAR